MTLIDHSVDRLLTILSPVKLVKEQLGQQPTLLTGQTCILSENTELTNHFFLGT